MPRQKFKPSGNSTSKASSANTIRARMNQAEVVLVFESASEEEALEAIATLPFAQLHLIDFDVIPLAPFYGLEHLSAPRS
jgi:hypothetical protein